MSDTKPNPEEIETATNEYEDIFARLASEEESEAAADDEVPVVRV